MRKEPVSKESKKEITKMVKERAKSFEKKHGINDFTQGRFEYLGVEVKTAMFYQEVMSSFSVLQTWDSAELVELSFQLMNYYE
jgi:hypothetical protein